MEGLNVPFDTIRHPFATTGSLIFFRRSNIVLDRKSLIVSNLIDKLGEIKFLLKLYPMSNLIGTYIAGGVEYMHPITLLLLFNLGVITFIIVRRLKKTSIDGKWIEAVKHVGGLAIAVGTFGTVWGLFLAFDALEAS